MSKLKEHLKDNSKNNKYIQSLRKVYLVGYWARYGALAFPYAGKMVENNEFGLIPLVYDFDDHNGTYGEYVLRELNQVTTGQIITYTFNEHIANSIAEQYNELYSYRKRQKEQDTIKVGDLVKIIDNDVFGSEVKIGDIAKVTYKQEDGLMFIKGDRWPNSQGVFDDGKYVQKYTIPKMEVIDEDISVKTLKELKEIKERQEEVLRDPAFIKDLKERFK